MLKNLSPLSAIVSRTQKTAHRLSLVIYIIYSHGHNLFSWSRALDFAPKIIHLFIKLTV